MIMMYYTFDIMIPNFIKTIKQILWRCISQSEIRNSAVAESEGGQKFLPPNPLPFCPPERLDFKIRNSDFRQKKFEHQSKNTAKNNPFYGGFIFCGRVMWREPVPRAVPSEARQQCLRATPSNPVPSVPSPVIAGFGGLRPQENATAGYQNKNNK